MNKSILALLIVVIMVFIHTSSFASIPEIKTNDSIYIDEDCTEYVETELVKNPKEMIEVENIAIETDLETEVVEEIEIIQETIEKNEVEIPNYIAKYVCPNNSFKSYMSYKAITNKSSLQYKLQQKAYTGEYGIRMVEGRYCIALGSYYSENIGTKIDLIMANGSILPCILGDQKADQHTDAQNIRARDGSVVEFIIDKKSLHKTARQMGDISYADAKFSGEILEIRVYE